MGETLYLQLSAKGNGRGNLSEGAYEGPRWVSAADAADAAGITPDQVRDWAREGVIASQSTTSLIGPQVMVRLDEVQQQARAASPEPGPDHPEGMLVGADLSPVMKAIPELVAQLTAATNRAARAEMKVEFLGEQLRALREWVGQVDLLPERSLTTTEDPAPNHQESVEEQPAEPVTEALSPDRASLTEIPTPQQESAMVGSSSNSSSDQTPAPPERSVATEIPPDLVEERARQQREWQRWPEPGDENPYEFEDMWPRKRRWWQRR